MGNLTAPSTVKTCRQYVSVVESGFEFEDIWCFLHDVIPVIVFAAVTLSVRKEFSCVLICIRLSRC